MKKVIKGKMYNTETADFLAGKDNRKYGDYYYFNEELYKTTKGRYFLYGEGGGATKYGNCSWCSTKKVFWNIFAFTETEAFEWLAEKDFPNVIEKEFPHLFEEA